MNPPFKRFHVKNENTLNDGFATSALGAAFGRSQKKEHEFSRMIHE
jgi:hypothetical protein